MDELNIYLDQLIKLSIEYAPKVLLAIVVLIIGWWVANRVTKLIVLGLKKSSADNKELQGFLSSIVGIGLKILVALSVAGIVGIETTSFVGIIAAMGFAVGLALQGNLSNFAAGVLILLMRPFKVGDEVKIQDFWAFVEDIQIFHTVLKQRDQTEVIIPNSVIMNGTIHNLSSTPTRSIFILLRVPFEEDFDKIVDLVTKAAFSIPEVDSSNKPFIWIADFESHYIQVSIGFSAAQKGFWATDFKVRKAVIDTFVKNKVKIAYPEGVEFSEFGKFSK